ncbi:hypothetical protein PF005_g7763 [Phytophthora fragariae]|uniref:Uncharacterized protein n=1 Tax=Phytophthora fragariae TaxID=53985 RepID=A0A6A3U7F9_9STRA|nr:hypothetical protein PF003_g23862 [Phytophthora fragariae]KAE8940546.1 hypothetical protein PF009_g9639 [Phytophthora fragariae]KAE9016356.1 hypothetical protein PF011_g7196 [Phytophthora fragariae]KAE9118639.1 hypothetical protein PF007_g8856 [Phytophthora fragariae]KAE9119706.1 hypothetical protein PF010_g7765 [Phytophthora fragariae]
MEDALVDYPEVNCQYPLVQMREMLLHDFGVFVSASLISTKLCDKFCATK